jgi:tetratricopeptide (TPR) repeat protein
LINEYNNKAENALNYYLKAIEYDNRIDALVRIGNIYLLESNFKKALIYFQKIYVIDKEDIHNTNSIGLCMLNLVY